MSPKRTAHFGSQSHIGTDRLLVRAKQTQLEQLQATSGCSQQLYASRSCCATPRKCAW
jgi:hypothetical protein